MSKSTRSPLAVDNPYRSAPLVETEEPGHGWVLELLVAVISFTLLFAAASGIVAMVAQGRLRGLLAAVMITVALLPLLSSDPWPQKIGFLAALPCGLLASVGGLWLCWSLRLQGGFPRLDGPGMLWVLLIGGGVGFAAGRAVFRIVVWLIERRIFSSRL